jgi:hypothetical protein
MMQIPQFWKNLKIILMIFKKEENTMKVDYGGHDYGSYKI